MAQVRSWAGVEVHARSVLAVTVDGMSGDAQPAAVGRDECGGGVLRVVAGADEGGV